MCVLVWATGHISILTVSFGVSIPYRSGVSITLVWIFRKFRLVEKRWPDDVFAWFKHRHQDVDVVGYGSGGVPLWFYLLSVNIAIKMLML